MLEDLDKKIAAMHQELEQKHAQFAELQSAISALSVTTKSADGALEVTVGNGGEVTHFAIIGDRHRKLPGAKLAENILTMLNAARAEYQAAVINAAPDDSLFGGVPTADIVNGQADLSSIFSRIGNMPDIDFPVPTAGGRRERGVRQDRG